MVDFDFLKSKKLPLGVFAGYKEGPKPARIMITLTYTKDFAFLLGKKGFVTTPKIATAESCKLIDFDIPVTPPTIKLDFGNSKDTENVARIGEVVLPKFKKAKQFRWESFFPYDSNAPYLDTKLRGLTKFNARLGSSQKEMDEGAKWYEGNALYQFGQGVVKNAKDAFSNNVLGNLLKTTALPETYVKIFQILATTEQPFDIAMSFYEGGNLETTKVTLDSFSTEPENNGDYKYEISVIEWTDIKPTKLDSKGNKIQDAKTLNVKDKVENKSFADKWAFWRWCKRSYPYVSKSLIWAVATYNGVRGLVFDGVLKLWKIKSTFKDLGGRIGILSNMFKLAKITKKDVVPISESLKKLSFSKANGKLASFVTENRRYTR